MKFKKILVANRGEIATRIVRTCREMGIPVVAVYEETDVNSLHVRLADEAVCLRSERGFYDQSALLSLAAEHEADAIHPGYGYLSEEADFIEACTEAGIAFIGPQATVVRQVRNKIDTLELVAQAGFATTVHAPEACMPDDSEAVALAAADLGYPVVLKSCKGGRGRGQQLVWSEGQLAQALRRARAEMRALHGTTTLYLEKAIIPAHQIGVQILADQYGQIIHLGEREGSILSGNRKIIEESPSPSLTDSLRAEICQAAVEIARLLNYDSVGTVEFIVDGQGNYYFSEIKARLQVEFTLSEMVSQIDLVREQIRLAAGQELGPNQEQIELRGWAMLTRLLAQNPWADYLPSPGYLKNIVWPFGAGIRVDTYLATEGLVPARYDAFLAKITAWGPDRDACLGRLRCAVESTRLSGTPTNVSLLQRLLYAEPVAAGEYDTNFVVEPFDELAAEADYYRDLAAIAAVLYLKRNQQFAPEHPERFSSGWHRSSRRLPA